MATSKAMPAMIEGLLATHVCLWRDYVNNKNASGRHSWVEGGPKRDQLLNDLEICEKGIQREDLREWFDAVRKAITFDGPLGERHRRLRDALVTLSSVTCTKLDIPLPPMAEAQPAATPRGVREERRGNVHVMYNDAPFSVCQQGSGNRSHTYVSPEFAAIFARMAGNVPCVKPQRPDLVLRRVFVHVKKWKEHVAYLRQMSQRWIDEAESDVRIRLLSDVAGYMRLFEGMLTDECAQTHARLREAFDGDGPLSQRIATIASTLENLYTQLQTVFGQHAADSDDDDEQDGDESDARREEREARAADVRARAADVRARAADVRARAADVHARAVDARARAADARAAAAAVNLSVTGISGGVFSGPVSMNVSPETTAVAAAGPGGAAAVTSSNRTMTSYNMGPGSRTQMGDGSVQYNYFG